MDPRDHALAWDHLALKYSMIRDAQGGHFPGCNTLGVSSFILPFS
jgi:hypothetical protein